MIARHIHLSPVGGMAGDMFAAAMLDALPELRRPVLEVAQTVLPADAKVTLDPGMSGGIAVYRFGITPPAQTAPASYPQLDARIDASGIDAAAKTLARSLLRRLAEAEAAVHRLPLEDVHFHEIADWDTLADFVAAGQILASLEGAGWSLDPLPLGAGRVRTRHGILPVPAPTTSRLLHGLPVQDDGVAGERITPTGAAIAAEIWSRAIRRPVGILGPTGYGAGTREIAGMANVLVTQVIEPVAAGEDATGVLEFDIDDMTGEEIATAAMRLRETPGVIDLTTAQRNGKKGRVVTAFRLLFRLEYEAIVANSCFEQSSTLGLRTRREARIVLPRSLDRAGDVQVKQVMRSQGAVTRKAEADDLAAGETLDIRRKQAREAET